MNDEEMHTSKTTNGTRQGFLGYSRI